MHNLPVWYKEREGNEPQFSAGTVLFFTALVILSESLYGGHLHEVSSSEIQLVETISTSWVSEKSTTVYLRCRNVANSLILYIQELCKRGKAAVNLRHGIRMYLQLMSDMGTITKSVFKLVRRCIPNLEEETGKE